MVYTTGQFGMETHFLIAKLSDCIYTWLFAPLTITIISTTEDLQL